MKKRLFFLFFLIFSSCDLSFDIDSPLIESFYPGKAENVKEFQDFFVKIVFSEEVNKDTVEKSFSLKSENEEKINGTFYWKSDREFVYYPELDEKINPVSIYNIVLEAKVEDKKGNKMSTPFYSFFYYQINNNIPFIVRTIPENNQKSNFSIYSNIIVEFSIPMDTNSVEKNFILSPSLKGNFYWSNDFKILIFNPSETFEAGKIYNLKIIDKAMSFDKTKLKNSYEISFIPGVEIEPPTINGVFLDHNFIVKLTNNYHGFEKNYTSLYVLFDKPIEISSLQEGIEINPQTKFLVYSVTNISNFLYQIKFNDTLISETNYSMVFSKNIRSSFGRKMEIDHKIIFYTDGEGSLRPEIRETVLKIEAGNYLLSSEDINYLFVSTNWNKNYSNLTIETEFLTGYFFINELSLYDNVKIDLIAMDSQKPNLRGNLASIVRSGFNSNLFIINFDNIGVSNYYKIEFLKEIMDENSNFIKNCPKSYYFYIVVTN